MASANVGAGGANMIEQLQMNQSELTDSLSRMLGPTGILALTSSLSRGTTGTGLQSQAAILKQLGLPTRTANMMAKIFQNPQILEKFSPKHPRHPKRKVHQYNKFEFQNIYGIHLGFSVLPVLSVNLPILHIYNLHQI